MKTLKLLLLVLPVLISSCAKSIVVNFSDDANATGKVNFQPSTSLGQASLVVNGKLLVDKQDVKKITVQNLPDGLYNYHLTCDNWRYAQKADAESNFHVQGEGEKTILIETPPYSNGYWMYMGLSTLGSWAALYFLLSLD